MLYNTINLIFLKFNDQSISQKQINDIIIFIQTIILDTFKLNLNYPVYNVLKISCTAQLNCQSFHSLLLIYLSTIFKFQHLIFH